MADNLGVAENGGQQNQADEETNRHILLDLSYVTDWLVLIAAACTGVGLNYAMPRLRTFLLIDPSLSYPFIRRSITEAVLWVVSLVVPAVGILLIELLIIDRRKKKHKWSTGDALKNPYFRWNLHAGMLGFAMSVSLAFLLSQGIKLFIGKPRPNMLARCQPDFSRIEDFPVSGTTTTARRTYVSPGICQFEKRAELRDAFTSFPSGHAAVAWAGLLYFALYFCYRFGVSFIYIPSDRHAPRRPYSLAAAAAPLYLLILPFAAICTALFITCSRYYDYNNTGIDTAVGTLLGIACAWFAFRWYHPEVKLGERGAWKPRNPTHPFSTTKLVVNELRLEQEVVEYELNQIRPQQQWNGPGQQLNTIEEVPRIDVEEVEGTASRTSHSWLYRETLQSGPIEDI